MKDLGLENILKLEQGLGRRAAWRSLVESQDERRSLSMVADPGRDGRCSSRNWWEKIQEETLSVMR